MSGTSGPALDALDLAALLCSRVCHDLINPVGAIVNGLEVMDSSNKAEDREFALDLIRKSATSTSVCFVASEMSLPGIKVLKKGSVRSIAYISSLMTRQAAFSSGKKGDRLLFGCRKAACPLFFLCA